MLKRVPIVVMIPSLTMQACVKICRFQDVIAVHRRCWGREQQIFDPLHYLPLLERKPHALAFARPLAGWTLPGCFEVLQHRMEWAMLSRPSMNWVGIFALIGRFPPFCLENNWVSWKGIWPCSAGCWRSWKRTGS